MAIQCCVRLQGANHNELRCFLDSLAQAHATRYEDLNSVRQPSGLGACPYLARSPNLIAFYAFRFENW